MNQNRIEIYHELQTPTIKVNKFEIINMTKALLFSILLFCLFACKSKDQQPEEIEKSAYLEDKNQVEVMVLQASTFTKQLVSNGKLAALHKSELKFRVGEEIASIEVNNGQKVKQAAIIAKLSTIEYQQIVQQAQTALEKSMLDFQDVLIGMGYELKDSANIPKDKMELAQIKSGYTNAVSNCEVALRNLSYCTLTAPFSGKVANIKQKGFEKASGDTFCT